MLLPIEKVKRLLELSTKNTWTMIEEFYKPYNQHCKILDSHIFEMMSAIINNTICTASGGSGWDTRNGIEVKSTCHVQSFMNEENEKISFFNDTYVGKRKIPRDGRCGINVESHFKNYNGLRKYNINLLEPTSDDPSCREFRIRSWDIKKDNEYFNEYARRQLTLSKSKSMNFQPLSADFYFSEPILILEGLLVLSKDYSNF